MIIKLNNKTSISIEYLFSIIKQEFPEYKYELQKRKRGEQGFIGIDSKYGVRLKINERGLTIYYEIQGFLAFILPEIFMPLYAPKAKKYERIFIERIAKIIGEQPE